MTTPGDDIAFLRAEDLAEFDALLRRFLDETGARAALLVDRTGRLLTAAGETDGFDRTTFASLAAADFGASDQLAALLGEPEFVSLFHHGEQGSMYLTGVGGAAILAALFDGRTTLGLVRLRLKTLIPAFAEQFVRLGEQSRQPLPELDADWALEAESEIDRIFSDEV
jgi:predicted regulator of Ras-like GTPase activity (Roadblock/LC7/MglB family)